MLESCRVAELECIPNIEDNKVQESTKELPQEGEPVLGPTLPCYLASASSKLLLTHLALGFPLSVNAQNSTKLNSGLR